MKRLNNDIRRKLRANREYKERTRRHSSEEVLARQLRLRNARLRSTALLFAQAAEMLIFDSLTGVNELRSTLSDSSEKANWIKEGF